MMLPLLGIPPRNIVAAVDFDGATAYLSRGADLTGNADSPQGILSAWVRLDGGNGSLQQLYFANGGVNINRGTDNKFRLVFAVGLAFESVATYTAGATWLHLLASWDTNFGAGSKVAHLYVNDLSDRNVTTNTGSAANIDYTQADHEIGAQSASALFNGCLTEFYFAPGQFLDFSVDANRRKFITADGKPEFLGDTGAIPTGAAPKVYLKGPVASFGANAGTGGNFTINGTLTGASTSPAG